MTPAFDDIRVFCEAHSSDVNATLPWLAAEIGHNDGYGTMLHFVRAWSGMRMYVSQDHAKFVAKVGFGVSSLTHIRVLRLANGAQIEVPSAWGVFLALRRAAIVSAVRFGLPPREISRLFGVTMRSLR